MMTRKKSEENMQECVDFILGTINEALEQDGEFLEESEDEDLDEAECEDDDKEEKDDDEGDDKMPAFLKKKKK